MKNKILILFLSFFISCSGSKILESNYQNRDLETFTNPLLSSGPDPWVLKKNNKYYYTNTTGNKLVIRETVEMEDLNQSEPLIIWIPPEGEEYSHQIWAPELHYINDKWYMYFAASYSDGSPNSMDQNRRMYVIENSSDSPVNNNWEFRGKVSDDTDHWAIDGTVMNYEGDNYFIWSGWRGKDQQENTGRQQLYIAKMLNPWTLEGSRVMISEPHFDWEKNGLVNEGPAAWKNPEGETFLFYSASGCWTDDYKIGILKLEKDGNPLNPDSWQKQETPYMKTSELNEIYAPGHNSVFKSSDGTDWILYHANDNPGDGCGGRRKPRMQKIEWDENGFPKTIIPVSVKEEIVVPSPEK